MYRGRGLVILHPDRDLDIPKSRPHCYNAITLSTATLIQQGRGLPIKCYVLKSLIHIPYDYGGVLHPRASRVQRQPGSACWSPEQCPLLYILLSPSRLQSVSRTCV